MIDWDDLFMAMVFLVAMKSKDLRTHIGAVIVGPDNEVVSMGFNGLARGLNDDVPERQERPEKYFWFEHAERNAIYNASRIGVSLKGCRMYTNGVPCMDCARACIQSGITEVIAHKRWYSENRDKWKESCSKAEIMLGEAGVTIRYYDKPIIQISGLRWGKKYKI